MLEQIDLLCAELNLAKRISEQQQNCQCPWTVHEYIKKAQFRNKESEEEKPLAASNSKYEIVRKILSGAEIITDEEIKELNEQELQEVISELLLTHEENSQDSSEVIENCYVSKCACKVCHCKNNFKEILQKNMDDIVVQEIKNELDDDDDVKEKNCDFTEVTHLDNKFADLRVSDSDSVLYCKNAEITEGAPSNVREPLYVCRDIRERVPLDHEMTVEEVEDDYASVSEVLWYFKKQDQDGNADKCILSESLQSMGEFNSDQMLLLQENNLQSSLLCLSSQQNLDDDLSPQRLFINKYLSRTYPKMGIDACVQTSIEKFSVPDHREATPEIHEIDEDSSTESCECVDKKTNVENIMGEIVAESKKSNFYEEEGAMRNVDKFYRSVCESTDAVCLENNSPERMDTDKYNEELLTKSPLQEEISNQTYVRKYISDILAKKKVRIHDPKCNEYPIESDQFLKNICLKNEAPFTVHEEVNTSITTDISCKSDSLTKNIKSALKNSSKESLSRNSSCSSKKSVEFEPTALEQNTPKFKPLSLETLPECLRPLSRSMEDMKKTIQSLVTETTQDGLKCDENKNDSKGQTTRSLTEIDDVKKCKKIISPSFLTKIGPSAKFEINTFAGYAFTQPNVAFYENVGSNINKNDKIENESVNLNDINISKSMVCTENNMEKCNTNNCPIKHNPVDSIEESKGSFLMLSPANDCDASNVIKADENSEKNYKIKSSCDKFTNEKDKINDFICKTNNDNLSYPTNTVNDKCEYNISLNSDLNSSFNSHVISSNDSTTLLYQSQTADNFSEDRSCNIDNGGILSSAAMFLNKIEDKNKQRSEPSFSPSVKQNRRPFSAQVIGNNTSPNKTTDSDLVSRQHRGSSSLQKRIKSTENRINLDQGKRNSTNKGFNTEFIEIYKTDLQENPVNIFSEEENKVFKAACTNSKIENDESDVTKITSSMLSVERDYYQEKILKNVEEALQQSSCEAKKPSCDFRSNYNADITSPNIEKSGGSVEVVVSFKSSENSASNISSDAISQPKESGTIKSPNSSEEIICFCPSLGSFICDSSKDSSVCIHKKTKSGESCGLRSSKSEGVCCFKNQTQCGDAASRPKTNNICDDFLTSEKSGKSRSLTQLTSQDKSFTSVSNYTESSHVNAEADYLEESFDCSEISPHVTLSRECTDFAVDHRQDSCAQIQTDTFDISSSTQSISIENNTELDSLYNKYCSCTFTSDNSGLDYFIPGIASENVISGLRQREPRSFTNYRSFCFLPIDIYTTRPLLNLSAVRSEHYPSVATQTTGDRMMDFGDGLRMEAIESDTDSDL